MLGLRSKIDRPMSESMRFSIGSIDCVKRRMFRSFPTMIRGTLMLASINVPLIMVGKDLNIRRFTQSMEPMLNLIDSDIGRSILDLKPNIHVPDLPELLRSVVNGGSPGVREIQGPKGRWFSMQALPYRGPDNKIDGALLVLLDIHMTKDARDYAKAIVETVRQPLLVLAKDFKVRSANRAFYETFKVSKAETENRSIYDLGNGQWNIPKLQQALENVLPKTPGGFVDFEVDHKFEEIGRKTMLVSAREIEQPAPYGRTILLAIERSEEHTSELQSPCNLVCRLLLEKKKKKRNHVRCNVRTQHM